MSAQGAVRVDVVGDDDVLDADTSAAVMRWMETGVAPDGIDPESWERWVEAGCSGQLEVDGVWITPAMLGRWASSGTLL